MKRALMSTNASMYTNYTRDFCWCGRIALIGIKWVRELSGYPENPDNCIFISKEATGSSQFCFCYKVQLSSQLFRFNEHGEDFLEQIITGDETSVHQFCA